MVEWAITEPLVRRPFLRAAGSLTFPVAGFAGNAFGFALTGNLVIELIHDARQSWLS